MPDHPDDKNTPIFKAGRLNPEKFGFYPARSSAGHELNNEALNAAAEILGRPLKFVDVDGFESELIAAAISSSGFVAYVESKAKEVGMDRYGAPRIDVSIRIHQVGQSRTDQSVDIESYNPFFGCDVRFFEWIGDAAVLIYREKHWTFACHFGDAWPPKFVRIEDRWVLNKEQLAYIGYKEEVVRRLCLPTLDTLEPISKDEAETLGLLP